MSTPPQMHHQQPKQTAFAHGLRSASTDAETALWQRLRSRQLSGLKFRRQFASGPYLADFVCVEYRLVLECDGGQHAESVHDEVRDSWMREQSWWVLRFWNHDVLQNVEGVLTVIAGVLEQRRGLRLPSPQPSPLKGEGAIPTPGGASAVPPAAACLTPSPFKGEGRGEGEMPAPPQQP